MCRTHNNLSCLNKLLLRVCFSLSECRSECDSCFDKNFCTRCRAGFYLHLGKCQESCPDSMVHNDTQRECVLSEFSWSEKRTECVHLLFPRLRFIVGAWKQVQLWLCLQVALQSVSCVWTARHVCGAGKAFTNWMENATTSVQKTMSLMTDLWSVHHKVRQVCLFQDPLYMSPTKKTCFRKRTKCGLLENVFHTDISHLSIVSALPSGWVERMEPLH